MPFLRFGCKNMKGQQTKNKQKNIHKDGKEKGKKTTKDNQIQET